MTPTIIIILVLAYGVGGAVCLLLGIIIGAAATGPREREPDETGDNDTYLAMWRKRQGLDL